MRFRIQLRDVEPIVWRRIVVPDNYTFWDLHVAIQDAMGWHDCHLHDFILADQEAGRVLHVGIPDDDGIREQETTEGWQMPISAYFNYPNRHAEYKYDFGDGWEHDVLLEYPDGPERKRRLPACLGGANACPPEDCGGPHGYQHLREILVDPKHEEHDSMLEWLGGSFDPARFTARSVKFDDPRKRWKRAFERDS
jgi:hypothetical protein